MMHVYLIDAQRHKRLGQLARRGPRNGAPSAFRGERCAPSPNAGPSAHSERGGGWVGRDRPAARLATVRAEVARERRTLARARASGLSAPRAAAAAAARAAVPSPASIYIDEGVLIAMAEAAAGVSAPRTKEAADSPGHHPPPAPGSSAAASHREHRQLFARAGSRGCCKARLTRLHALLLSAFRALHPLSRRIVLRAFPALHHLLVGTRVPRGKLNLRCSVENVALKAH